ncbi:MAG TPA: NAD(+) diphosphatase [Mycobacteriales bacterium]|nr:NAD(+) diphosphatase [Mycobacteriales bacterium]
MTVPSLSRSAADRVAHHRDDDEWLAAAWESGSLLVIDDQSRAAVIDDGPQLVFVDSGTWQGDGDRFLLGVGDGTAYWGTVGELPRRLGSRPLGIRDVGASLNDLEAGLLVATIALANWHRNHPRCPRDGAMTRVAQAGWSRICEVDGSQHFPRTDPAVIVLLHDGGDRALLGRQPSWPRGRYSTIAGFVEAGESAEHCVSREVREETGVEVDDVTYRGSQPWPFPQSLMLGYEARVVGGEVDNVDKELEDVRWFTRNELRSGDPLLPPPASIAHWLITTWLDRPAGRS